MKSVIRTYNCERKIVSYYIDIFDNNQTLNNMIQSIKILSYKHNRDHTRLI